MRMRRSAVSIFLLAWTAAAAAQDKAPAPPRTFSIVGATIHPVSGPEIAGGTIVVRDGKIASVSAGAAPEPGAPVVDGKGKHVYPSLFPPMTVLGLEEIDAVRATLDKQELGGINPAARADSRSTTTRSCFRWPVPEASSSPESRPSAASSPGRPWRHEARRLDPRGRHAQGPGRDHRATGRI